MRMRGWIGAVVAGAMLIVANGALAVSLSDVDVAVVNARLDNDKNTGYPLSASWTHSNPYSGLDYDTAASLGLITGVSLTINTPTWYHTKTSNEVGVTFTDASSGTHDLGDLTQGAAFSSFVIDAGWLDGTAVESALAFRNSTPSPQLVDFEISTSALTVNYSRLYELPTADADGCYPYSYTEGNPVTALALDAQLSTHDPLTSLAYSWDLDNNGSYETPAGGPLFSLLDPVGAFGNTSGLMTIGLQVFDGYNYATTTTCVDYQYTSPTQNQEVVPEPLTMMGALLGICGAGGYFRKRVKLFQAA